MGLLRPDLGPVLPGEGGECGQVRLGVDQHLGDSEGKASLKASMTCWYWAMTACLLVGAKMVETSALTGLERAEPNLKVMLRVKRGAAALPGGSGKDRPDGGPDAGVRITGDQDHALGVVGRGDLEAALSQGPQDKDVQKSVVSASPRAMFRDLPAPFGRHAGGHHQRLADHPPAHPHIQVGGARRTGGGTRCDPGGGTGTRARPRRSPCRSARPWTWRSPTRCPGPARGRQALRVETPSIHAEQITAHLGLVHPPAGVEQGGEERPGAKLGDGELDLPGGGGHRLGPRAVAPVGALRRARRGAPRRSRRRPRRRPGPAARPGAGGGRRPSSEIGVGKDFPDQRGHGPLVRGGHRGCTPCESWSKNLGSHDARRPHGPADPSTPRAPRELPPH